MSDGGVDIRVTVDSDKLSSEIRRVGRTIGELQPVMKEIGRAVVILVNEGFMTSRDPYGVPWHKPVAWRKFGKKIVRNTGQDWQPLRDIGTLKNSQTYIAEQKAVKIGTNLSYAEQHQVGSGRVWKRSFLPDRGLPTAWQREVMDTLNDYLRIKLNGS